MSSSTLIINIIRYIALYLFQVLILFNVNIHPSINLYIYPLFVLMLPIRIPHALMLLLAFSLGILVGISYNAVGQHAVAITLIAFLRPTILSIMEPRGGYEPSHSPNKAHFGFSWYFQYASIALIIHFCTLFYLETFSFTYITIGKIIFSYLVSMLIILLIQVLFNPKV
jgi:hypothetical protein